LQKPKTDSKFMSHKKYQDNLDYLFGLSKSGIKLGLENTRRLLSYFGDPQLKIPTVHIAGTNGKGSTSAMTEAILRASGYRVGLYTSPHLIDFCERIQINRNTIDNKSTCDLISQVKKATETLNLQITFFEFSTVMAFLYFYENKTDWNVIEVGLGGRLDATNLCQAEISIITSISLDHTEYLGTDLKQIAFEKASIIKPGGMVIADLSNEETIAVVRQQCQKHSAKLYLSGVDFKTEEISHTPNGQIIKYSDKETILDNLELPLIGKHQINNSSLSICCAIRLKDTNKQITEQGIRDGLKSVSWKGRLEVVSTNPTMLLDCAHNPDGVKRLTATISDYFTYERCHFILGIMKDKPCFEMIDIISHIADRIIFVKPKQERSWDLALLQEKLQKSHKVVEIIEEIHYAINIVKKTSAPNDLICITGSIFTVAEAKQYIDNEGLIKINPDSFLGIPPPY
jgi:dihydrofolate synthase/folylpolyglutamate synthase